MKELDCPVDGCHATIEAETQREIMVRVEEHAASSHPELVLTDETIEDIKSKITDV